MIRDLLCLPRLFEPTEWKMDTGKAHWIMDRNPSLVHRICEDEMIRPAHSLVKRIVSEEAHVEGPENRRRFFQVRPQLVIGRIRWAIGRGLLEVKAEKLESSADSFVRSVGDRAEEEQVLLRKPEGSEAGGGVDFDL